MILNLEINKYNKENLKLIHLHYPKLDLSKSIRYSEDNLGIKTFKDTAYIFSVSGERYNITPYGARNVSSYSPVLITDSFISECSHGYKLYNIDFITKNGVKEETNVTLDKCNIHLKNFNSCKKCNMISLYHVINKIIMIIHNYYFVIFCYTL